MLTHIKLVSPQALDKALCEQFPISAVSWAQAPEEVREMSRYARGLLDLDETHAVDFRRCDTPAEWNSLGIASIVKWYTMMGNTERELFCSMFNHWLTDWVRP